MEQRRELQAMDAAEFDPIVLIDNDWEPRFLAGSVMTQLIDWHFRIRDNADDLAKGRPAVFATEPGSGRVLVSFKRASL